MTYNAVTRAATAARAALCCAAVITTGLAVSGCPGGGTTSKVSKAEEADFKGGPMPADFKPNVGDGPPKTVPPK